MHKYKKKSVLVNKWLTTKKLSYKKHAIIRNNHTCKNNVNKKRMRPTKKHVLKYKKM